MGALALVMAIAAMQPAAEPYRAHGNEPFWALVIGEGRIRYEPADGAAIEVAAPRPRVDEMMREYPTPRLSVTIFPGDACSEGRSDRRYADRVWVRIGAQDLQGCGGRILAADDLTGTSWLFAEIAGDRVPLTGDLLRDSLYAIDFGSDGFVGYDGCNRFSAAYSRDGEMLTAHAPWGSTATRCSEPVMARERRLMQILAAPVRVSLPDPNTLVLSGEQGIIRLQRVPDHGR